MRFKKSFRKMLAMAIAAGCFAITVDGVFNMREVMGERRHLAEQHAERVGREKAERMRDEARIQEKQREEERRRQYAVELEQRRIDGESHKAQENNLKEASEERRKDQENQLDESQEMESRKIQENPLKEEPKTESRKEANINKFEQRNGLTEKTISEAYFDNFIKEPPKFETMFGEGGDLAKTSSVANCYSTYKMMLPETDEQMTFVVAKWRTAAAFGADTTLFIWVTYNLKTNPIVSKKRQPIFELQVDGKINTIKLNKISRYETKGFSVKTGNVHFLDELYVNGATVTLLLSNEKNETIRVPIAKEVIEQWKQVTSADLKKMKYEYEER